MASKEKYEIGRSRIFFLCLFSLATTLLGQSDWTWRNPLPQGNTLTSVAWCGDQFVAAGEAGSILVSTDGISWKTKSLAHGMLFYRVACSDSQIIAIGFNGSLFTSTDTDAWTSQVSDRFEGLTSLVWSGKIWVAIGDQKILTSTDGLVWSDVVLTNLEDLFSLHSIAWNGKIFVVTSRAGYILTSTDGKNWSSQFSGKTTPIYSVIWTGTVFAAMSGYDFLTSVDGLVWNRQATSPVGASLSPMPNQIAWDGNQYLRIINGTITASRDGINWLDTLMTSRLGFSSLASSEGRSVAVGSYGNIVFSQDGKNWMTVTKTKGWKFNDLTWTGEKFIVVGDESTILTSGNGIDWQPITQTFDSSLFIPTVLWTGSRLVAFANNNVTLTSDDGTTWALHEYEPPYTIFGAIWTGKNIAAVWAGGMYLSPDGISWNFKPFPVAVHQPKVVWDGERYVVAGREGILTSSDGETWDHQSFDASFMLSDIAWSGSRFVVIGNQVILNSTDGNSWTTQATKTQHLSTVIWSGQHFMALGQGGDLHVSPDGLTWTQHSTGTLSTNAIAYNDDFYVIAAFNGILTSPRRPLSNIAMPKRKRLVMSDRRKSKGAPFLPSGFTANGKNLAPEKR